MNALTDTTTLVGYELRRSLKNPTWVIFGILQPILWLILFAPLLRSVIPMDSLRIFAPGMLFMIVLYGNLYQGFDLVAAMRSGLLERLAATPASRTALLLGRNLRDALVTLVQAVIMLGVAWLMGLRASPSGTVALLALNTIVGMWGAALSYGLALRIRDESGLASTVSFLALPLLLISGVILPFSFAPAWLRDLAHVNPFYYIVDAGRDLLVGQYGDPFVPAGFGLGVVLAACTLAWAVRVMRHAVV